MVYQLSSLLGLCLRVRPDMKDMVQSITIHGARWFGSSYAVLGAMEVQQRSNTRFVKLSSLRDIIIFQYSL